MLLARRFDERLLSLQRQGRIGTFPPISGQEAAHLGAAAVLRPSDWVVPAFREMAADIWRGRSLESIIVYNNGFNEGGRIPADRNDMPISVPVGSQILHAVGIAWAMRYRGKDDVAMTFFGDGATSQGDFHEGLNFAGVFQVPVVFVCQNNQWAISIPRSKQTRSKTLAQKALAYGIPGIQVDGNDILAVYVAAQGGKRACPCRGRGHPDRVRHLPHGRAHHRRRSQTLPHGRRSGRVAPEGSHHPLPGLPHGQGAIERRRPSGPRRRRLRPRSRRPWSAQRRR